MKFISLLLVVLVVVSSANASKRSENIVGGIPAAQRQLPFIVSLTICGSSCGGFLLTPTHVGTAAHCFASNTTASCITAQAGTIDVSVSTNGQLRNASSFNLHPQYNDTTLAFDAAIITLATPFIIDNTNVRIAPLETNSSNLPAVNATVWVAGWGDTQTGGPASLSSLLLVDLPYSNFTACNVIYNSTLTSGNQICAGGNASKDSCQGDSGGPLFTTTNIADPIDAKIIGIVSFGPQNCATAGTPGVYSDVPGYANAFFQTIIGQSASIPASSPAPSSVAPSSVAPSSVALSSVAPSSVAASSVAASSVAASSAVASSGAVLNSSVVAVASSGSVAASSVPRSSVVAAASSGAVAASSGAVAASSVPRSSGAAGASAAATKTPSGSPSGTPSGSPPASSGALAASSVARSSGAAASASTSKVISAKTKTGLAAINCRQTCQATFRSCKKTSRRIRTCKRAKKVCVAGCGVVNPNRN